MLLSAVSIVITAAVLGSYVFKRLRLNKWLKYNKNLYQ